MCSNRDMNKRSLEKKSAGRASSETSLPPQAVATADQQKPRLFARSAARKIPRAGRHLGQSAVWGERARGETPAGFTRLLAAGIGWLGLFVAGCSRPVDDTAVGPTPLVTLSVVDHAGLMKEVASHLGKVVVLDCWSTSCPPCVKEFPGLVALAERHGARVACLSLAFDYDGSGDPEDLVPPIQRFLEKTGAGRVTNLLSSEPADSLYHQLDLTSVPAVYVWKPNWERAIRYDDDLAARELGRPFTYEDVEKTVVGLLAE